MGLRVEVEDRDHRVFRQLVISCERCGAEVNDRQIKDDGGLLEMGWRRHFNDRTRRNEYFCPKHT